MKHLKKLEQDLKKFRKQIDKIDSEIIKLLCKRFLITNKIGILKKEYNILPRDKKRENKIFKRIENLSIKRGLNPNLILKIYKLIFKEVVKNHKKIRNEKD